MVAVLGRVRPGLDFGLGRGLPLGLAGAAFGAARVERRDAEAACVPVPTLGATFGAGLRVRVAGGLSLSPEAGAALALAFDLAAKVGEVALGLAFAFVTGEAPSRGVRGVNGCRGVVDIGTAQAAQAVE